jgi:PDDEXK-like domain of unknown function (DUF3799)
MIPDRPSPGRVVFDLPHADYDALKALSASGAWTLAKDCPAKFLWKSPWNPLRERDDKPEFDIGKAAHLAVLEPALFAERTVLVDAPNYKTAKAQALRDEAYAVNRTPLLPWQAEIVGQIAGSIRAHPIAAEAFTGGEPEVSMTWCDAGTGTPCKLRTDWLPRHGRWLVDLKTAASANPTEWRDQAARLGYYARAAWYLDGAEAVLGRRPEEYWFVVVEKEPPYLVSVIAFDEADLEWGRLVNRRALSLFADCVARREWPGYREPGAGSDRAFRVSLPPWAVYRLQDRSEAGAFANDNRHRGPIDPALLRAAERFLSPHPHEES